LRKEKKDNLEREGSQGGEKWRREPFLHKLLWKCTPLKYCPYWDGGILAVGFSEAYAGGEPLEK